MTIQLRLPYRFSNPFDEDVVFINTLASSFFVEYFRALQKIVDGAADEDTDDLMRRFATIPVTPQMMESYETTSNDE